MTLQKTNSQNPHQHTSWSVQVSLTGLSFLSIPQLGQAIHAQENFPVPTTAEGLTQALKQFWLPHYNASGQNLTTKVFHQSPYATVVPLALFDANKGMDYLKLNTRLLKTDVVAFDILEAQELVVVYIPFTNVNNLVFDTVGPFEFEHSATGILRHLLTTRKSIKNTEVYANIYRDSFDLIVIEPGRLILYNNYAYHAPEDFLYYLLFGLEQLNLNPEEVNLYLSGEVSKADALFQSAYTYVRHVSLYTDHQLKNIAQVEHHQALVLKTSL